jgi:hypothetical protein
LIDRENTSYNKDCSTTTSTPDRKNPIKKVHCVSKKLFIVIDEEIAKHLDITEYDSWLEQVQTDDGILLRKYFYDHARGGVV